MWGLQLELSLIPEAATMMEQQSSEGEQEHFQQLRWMIPALVAETHTEETLFAACRWRLSQCTSSRHDERTGRSWSSERGSGGELSSRSLSEKASSECAQSCHGYCNSSAMGDEDYKERSRQKGFGLGVVSCFGLTVLHRRPGAQIKQLRPGPEPQRQSRQSSVHPSPRRDVEPRRPLARLTCAGMHGPPPPGRGHILLKAGKTVGFQATADGRVNQYR